MGLGAAAQRAQQRTTETMTPNTHDLRMEVTISQPVSALNALSITTLQWMLYPTSARNTLAAKPIAKQRMLSTGPAIMQASTRGVMR